MADYFVELRDFTKVQELVCGLEALGIRATICPGGVEFSLLPEQLESARAICLKHEAPLVAGRSHKVTQVIQGAEPPPIDCRH